MKIQIPVPKILNMIKTIHPVRTFGWKPDIKKSSDLWYTPKHQKVYSITLHFPLAKSFCDDTG